MEQTLDLAPDRLMHELFTLPSRIARKSVEAEEAWAKQRTKELELEIEEARLYLSIKAVEFGLTVKELQMRVLKQESYQTLRLACIQAEVMSRKLRIEVKELDDLLMSLKKIVTLREIELRSVGGGP